MEIGKLTKNICYHFEFFIQRYKETVRKEISIKRDTL